MNVKNKYLHIRLPVSGICTVNDFFYSVTDILKSRFCLTYSQFLYPYADEHLMSLRDDRFVYSRVLVNASSVPEEEFRAEIRKRKIPALWWFSDSAEEFFTADHRLITAYPVMNGGELRSSVVVEVSPQIIRDPGLPDYRIRHISGVIQALKETAARSIDSGSARFLCCWDDTLFFAVNSHDVEKFKGTVISAVMSKADGNIVENILIRRSNFITLI